MCLIHDFGWLFSALQFRKHPKGLFNYDEYEPMDSFLSNWKLTEVIACEILKRLPSCLRYKDATKVYFSMGTVSPTF